MKVRFVHFDSPEDVSGVSTWLRRLLPSLQHAGWDVSLDLLHFQDRPGANTAFFRSAGISLRVASRPVSMHGATRRCLRWVAEDPPDVYVPNCILGAYFAGRWVRAQHIPTVGILHSDDDFHAGLIDEFVAGGEPWRVSAMVAVSHHLEQQATASANGFTQVSRIGYGTPVPPKRDSLRPDRVFRVAYIGRLVQEQKRIREVTAAFCEAARRLEAVEAWIVGEGSERESVEAILAQARLGDRVRLLGRVEPERVPAILGQCHAFALLSDYEGLPVSLLEAMAEGVVPICLSMRSGIHELVRDGENGLLVADRGPAFLSAVECLCNDRAKWARLSAAARATVEESFSHEKMVSQWLDLLQSLARQARRPARFAVPWKITLPSRNPKFGGHDMRPTMVESLVANSRIWLGARRRELRQRSEAAQTGNC